MSSHLHSLGTKAEVLETLQKMGLPVPLVLFFSSKQWRNDNTAIIDNIQEKYRSHSHIVIRSSALSEDTYQDSMAGAYDSVLNVDLTEQSIRQAVNKVMDSYDDNPDNQILIQPMVTSVLMSGVVMTKVLDDGSPYYVINYDDSTGKTDTVTSGNSINKTVYVYNGVKDEYFDSPLLLEVIQLVRKVSSLLDNIPLDIEFALSSETGIHLLQARPITTHRLWNDQINQMVSDRIEFLEDYLQSLMARRQGLAGSKTLLGLMPDWNPAEMIGVVPRPLSRSLYRKLITKSTWRIAREQMGYRKLVPTDLMVSLYGRTYIDIRNSFNSLLPAAISEPIAEKLINAYIARLEATPHLHDKVEFEVVLSAYDFSFDQQFEERYADVLTAKEKLQFKHALHHITQQSILDTPDSTLNRAYRDIEQLKARQQERQFSTQNKPFALADEINHMIDECIQLGTLPFSIIARHGFIAESLMRSIIAKQVITTERINTFKQSVKTVATQMSSDFASVSQGTQSQAEFIEKYGHLRPSSYDIMSLSYAQRSDLFDTNSTQNTDHTEFTLSQEEINGIDMLLLEHGFREVEAKDLFTYAEKAIVGREYAKFIFTRHLSDILELIAQWGDSLGFDREQTSMLTLEDITQVLFSPLTDNKKRFFEQKISTAKEDYKLAKSFKLSYLIRSIKDIYIAPLQRSVANFIGEQSITKPIVVLTPYSTESVSLEGKIVCIEGADPGYDWIFTRNIAGLVTKYGGANSHMAIRCAEQHIPAAIGYGEQSFEKLIQAKSIILNCEQQRIELLN